MVGSEGADRGDDRREAHGPCAFSSRGIIRLPLALTRQEVAGLIGFTQETA